MKLEAEVGDSSSRQGVGISLSTMGCSRKPEAGMETRGTASIIYNEEAVLDTLTLGFLSSELRQWIPDAGAGWFVALHCNSISKLRLVCCEHRPLTLEIEDF